MKVFTIGYGGRKPADFVLLLQAHGVQTVVDVRAAPNRASMGAYVKARSPEKGIEARLHAAGIGYSWVEALGNPYRKEPNWRPLYAEHLLRLPETWIAEISKVTQPACLLCAERHAEDCHRSEIARVLERRGFEVIHIA